MKKAAYDTIRKAACEVANQATNIEREVESTSEIADKVMELYTLADEIVELAEEDLRMGRAGSPASGEVKP